MFRWLSRYVKRIDVYGVGIELREIPPEEALPLLFAIPTPAPLPPATTPVAQGPPATGPVDSKVPVVVRQDFVRVSGTSPSSHRAPREIDLMADGDDIQIHIHPPNGSQPIISVGRKALQDALDQWKGPASGEPVTVSSRTRRKEAQMVFVVEAEGEVEVREAPGWWIWVPRHDLKAALEALGIRVPWQ